MNNMNVPVIHFFRHDPKPNDVCPIFVEEKATIPSGTIHHLTLNLNSNI